MTSRRDQLLQQLGIAQWKLHRPAVLQGEVVVNVPEEVHLLIVAYALPNQEDPLLHDVLRSLGLIPQQVYSLTPDQVAVLPEGKQCNSWRLGINEPLKVTGAQLHSPVLAELCQDADAKCLLWQQICRYEYYFHPETR